MPGRQGWPLRQAWGNGRSFPTSPPWLGHSTGTCCCQARLHGEAMDLALTGSVVSKPARGRPSSLWEELICPNLCHQPGTHMAAFLPTFHRSPTEEEPCSHQWTASVELQTRVLTSHRVSQGEWSLCVNGGKAYEVLARTPVSSYAQEL